MIDGFDKLSVAIWRAVLGEYPARIAAWVPLIFLFPGTGKPTVPSVCITAADQFLVIALYVQVESTDTREWFGDRRGGRWGGSCLTGCLDVRG